MTLDVVHIIPTLTTGGAERQLEMLVGRSTDRCRTVALYRAGPVADGLRAAGHRVDVLGMRGWRKPLAALRLARLLRRERPDVVHVHLLAAQLWGIPAARLARVPVVVSSEHSLMESTIEGRPRSRWLQVLYRVLEHLAGHTVAVSDATAERLRDWGVPADRITVIDNGIDFDALAPSSAARREVRAELGIAPGTVVIGVVGRLEPVKRIDRLLRAAADRLRAGGHTLVVAGGGDELPALRELARELGVQPAVRWLGPRPDVPRLLSAMDVLVSPSRDETFGMAVVEALGSGLPVVFGQCPALDALTALPAWALPLPPEAGDEAEPAAIAAALDELTAAGLHRRPVPAELVRRYAAAATAEHVHDLYVRLAGAAGTRHPATPPGAARPGLVQEDS